MKRDIKEYIASGILQDYCLGFLTPEEKLEVEAFATIHKEVEKELALNMRALQSYAAASGNSLSPYFKERTASVLDNIKLESTASINNLPALNKFSDHQQWLRLVKDVLPSQLKDDMFIKVLRNDDTVFQTLVWTKTGYPDEVHDDLQECFMILEGECECYIGDETIRMGPGDFLEVPMHLHHDVKVITGPVLAIVQRVAA